MTCLILFGIECASFLHRSADMSWHHVYFNQYINSCIFLGARLATFLVIISQSFSIGFKSGEFPGLQESLYGVWWTMPWQFWLCDMVPSLVGRLLSSGLQHMVTACVPVWKCTFVHSLFHFFGTKCKDPRPVAEKQPQTIIFSGCFIVGLCNASHIGDMVDVVRPFDVCQTGRMLTRH